MNFPRPVVYSLLFGLLIPGAVGRVGESEPELTIRYGTVVSRQPARKFAQGRMYIYGERLSFRTTDWIVSALVLGGRCEEINYAKPGKWADWHFKELLELNGGHAQWTEQKTRNPNNRRDWLRKDQTTAGWGLSGFMVRTPAAEQVLANVEQTAREEAAKARKS